MFTLHQDEKVILEVRKHWFVIFSEAFILFIIALIPLVLFFFISKIFPQIKEVEMEGNSSFLFSFFYFLWLLGIWIAFFVSWTDYYLDVWYITPKRIVDMEQRGLFSREIIDLRFEKVQDATVDIRGIIPTLLNFGDIHIQTAGADRKIILKSARNANEAKKIILLQHSIVMEKNHSHQNPIND